ncbi:efflux RND transporter periplasmic adaptor subunit [Chitinophaga sp. CF118]|uniref:efflux RND transporter periplasmic adaptor subunit n=1 Tax=Chitinophaga sp. CF118 TaxID=1884367 RepID=UPI000B04DA16|nr:efflux RND transporter periplasmic adaptor subunit [Chitinophaga sp. CF118]
MNNKKALAITIVCSLQAVLLLSGCGHSEGKADKGENTSAQEVISVPAITISKGKLSSTLQIPGELVAFQQVDIYAKVSSFVKKLHVDVGSEVTTGQLLATMEAPEITSQLSGAESRLKSQEAVYLASKANYDRLYETSKTPGTVSKNDLDIAQARQKSDQAQLESAKAAYKEITDNRNYLEIRAPFSGIVSARNVSAGAYVGPTGKGSEFPLFTLQEQKKLRLVISVPEAYTSYLGNNSEVNFSVKAYTGKTFTAKVNRLSGVMDTRLRSQRIEMDVINNDKKLMPGMIAEVKIPMNTADSAFIVPKSAVVNSTVNVFVIRVVNGKSERVLVQTGREADGKIEVYGNLNPGDTIVSVASEEIRDGAELKHLKFDK